MPGPAPKSAATRQRRNKKSTAATLLFNTSTEIPEIPNLRQWNEETVEEWDAIWESPMAGQFIDADYHGVLKLIVLVDDYWKAESHSQRVALSVEIRLQRADFGLTPLARGRLHWELDRGEKAAEETQKRKDKRRSVNEQKPSDQIDPRQLVYKDAGIIQVGGPVV